MPLEETDIVEGARFNAKTNQHVIPIIAVIRTQALPASDHHIPTLRTVFGESSVFKTRGHA